MESTHDLIIEHGPTVYLVGMTTPTEEIYDYLGDRELQWTTNETMIGDPTAVIEMGGRICYESWNNAHRRTRGEYIQKQLIGKQHGSVLEHTNFNLIVSDVPRSVQMEMIRHRQGMGYSWTSQRYVDKSLRFIVPPALRQDEDAKSMFITTCLTAMRVYERLVDEKLADIQKPTTAQKKEAREAARGVLPNAMASDGVVTMNARAARHIIETRSDASADQSIRELAYAIYVKLSGVAPALFEDAVVTPIEGKPHYVPEVKFTNFKV